MVQHVLMPDKGVAGDLHLALHPAENEASAYLGTALLARVSLDPEELRHRLFVGYLANANWKLKTLSEAFGHDNRTIKRWAAALVTDDAEEATRLLNGRGANRKATEPVARFVKRRYREMKAAAVRDYRARMIVEVEDCFGVKLGKERLRQLFREADAEAKEADENDGFKEVKDSATGGASTEVSSVEETSSGHQSPIFSADWIPPVLSEQGPGPRPKGVHHLGLILALWLLTQVRQEAFAGLGAQWLGQLLQGAVNVEQSRKLNLEDLALLVGPTVRSHAAQRDALHALASPDSALAAYAANARLLSDGPGSGEIFYYDPHAKEYAGMHRVLKGWCGSRHGVAKVLYLDAVHTRSGRCCFIEHFSPYRDLRERFFLTLARFDLLFPPERARGRTFVVDRGAFSKAFFEAVVERGDHLITWEKDYRRDAWDEEAATVAFSRVRPRNNARDLRRWSFECQEAPWPKSTELRRIVVRAVNPNGRRIEVSVLATNPKLSVEETVWLIFNRWIQENDFKSLDVHFGIDQLTSHKTRAFADAASEFEDKTVDSLEYRELKTQLKNLENQLARRLLRLDKLTDKKALEERRLNDLASRGDKLAETSAAELQADVKPDAALTAKIVELRKLIAAAKAAASRTDKSLVRVQNEIAALKAELVELERRLINAVREDSRIRLLVDNQYRLLDVRAKAHFDALRVTAANVFATLVDLFRPLYGNYRHDHEALRVLLRSDGFVHRDGNVLHARLWLKGSWQPWQLKAFNVFLGIIQQRTNAALSSSPITVKVSIFDGSPTL